MGDSSGSAHVDVVIVGAGLSGIAAAYYLQTRCPGISYVILERRDAIGGTWDLFRYPGVRSDSDMHTLGYSFRQWHGDKALADGPSILAYVRETASAYGIDRAIRFGQAVTRALWSSAEARWTVEASADGGASPLRYTCAWLFTCSGYYDYAGGYTPDWPGTERFRGRIVHPQGWPADLDVAGKRVVVIGSGATAVTLVPELAKKAEHVTMLQRSPTYIASRPARDATANWIARRLPRQLGGAIVRWKNVLFGMYVYRLSRTRPAALKRMLVNLVRRQLGDAYDVRTHFTPAYDPWDQRLCLVPDGDLFAAIRSGSVSVVTDHIACFTERGLRLRSGEELDADVIVTATGLRIQLLGGMQLVVDGKPVDVSTSLTYKGMMYSDVPNLASAMGYTNASWTLKCELTARYVCRLITFMDRKGYAYATPRADRTTITEQPALALTSGYVQRAQSILPKQGSRPPWKLHQNYLLDLLALRFGKLRDEAMVFTKRNQPASSGSRSLRSDGPP